MPIPLMHYRSNKNFHTALNTTFYYFSIITFLTSGLSLLFPLALVFAVLLLYTRLHNPSPPYFRIPSEKTGNSLFLSILVAHRPLGVQLFCQIVRIPAVLITGETAPFEMIND